MNETANKTKHGVSRIKVIAVLGLSTWFYYCGLIAVAYDPPDTVIIQLWFFLIFVLLSLIFGIITIGLLRRKIWARLLYLVGCTVVLIAIFVPPMLSSPVLILRDYLGNIVSSSVTSLALKAEAYFYWLGVNLPGIGVSFYALVQLNKKATLEIFGKKRID